MAHDGDWRRKLTKRAGRRLLDGAGRVIRAQSKIPAEPVFPPSVFPWTERFEQEWTTVRAELEPLLAERERLPAFHEVSPDQKRISREDHWKVFPLFVFGDPCEENCRRCPETTRLLSSVPGLRNAMFSILSPRYRIPPHRGPTNGIIRIHLGLIVPRDAENCRIRVADRVFGWSEGRCVVFDDHYEHEVWNDTDEQRVVLFFDVDRPLRPLGRALNRLLIAGIKRSRYVQDAKDNIRRARP